MWWLNYQKCNSPIRHRKLYVSKRALKRKIISLSDADCKDVKVIPIWFSQPIDDCDIWLVEYRECNITKWRHKYFFKESKANAFMEKIRKKRWDDCFMKKIKITELI